LEQVERERDEWQRPSEVIQELELKEGNVVVDLGSGVGYFALKLSRTVGKSGKVVAVDIQRFPLYVLQTRALGSGQHNFAFVLGEPDDPHLSANSIDAILVANTYHELSHPNVVLKHLLQALKPGGHLVVVDHGPPPEEELPEPEAEHHEIAPTRVESDIRKEAFEIVRREDRLTVQSEGHQVWWLIAARKPI
jgi:ubiquinone/menaquinone biosynthesis C-methylase UbiE